MRNFNILVITATPYRRDYKSRFLDSYLNLFSKENIFYFYVTDTDPESNSFNSSYKLTDRMMLRHFLSRTVDGEIIKTDSAFDSTNGLIKEGKHLSPLIKKVVRSLLWRKKRWKSEFFKKWVQEINPDAVLLIWHENTFLSKIAQDISEELNIPLYISINDDYIFCNNSRSNFNYAKKYFSNPNVRLFYISNAMKRKYDSVFNKNGVVIPPTTASLAEKLEFRFPIKKTVYFGSVSLGRLDTLLFFAKETDIIGIEVDVYANSFLSSHDLAKIKKQKNINLKEPVSYEEIKGITSKYDAVLLVEELYNFKYINQVRYSLSTKIADSLGNEKIKLFIGNRQTGLIDFALENRCGFVITESDDPCKVINSINNKTIEVIHKSINDIYTKQLNSQSTSNKFLSILKNDLS